MAEYIERGKAIAMRFTDGIDEDGVVYVPYRDVASHLKSLPAADVVEVVRGEWCTLYAKRTVLVRTDGYVCRPVECSICGKYLIGSGDYSVYGRFCPCCGAKMRGETDED